jgi:hypothetical protein
MSEIIDVGVLHAWVNVDDHTISVSGSNLRLQFELPPWRWFIKDDFVITYGILIRGLCGVVPPVTISTNTHRPRPFYDPHSTVSHHVVHLQRLFLSSPRYK